MPLGYSQAAKVSITKKITMHYDAAIFIVPMKYMIFGQEKCKEIDIIYQRDTFDDRI